MGAHFSVASQPRPSAAARYSKQDPTGGRQTPEASQARPWGHTPASPQEGTQTLSMAAGAAVGRQVAPPAQSELELQGPQVAERVVLSKALHWPRATSHTWLRGSQAVSAGARLRPQGWQAASRGLQTGVAPSHVTVAQGSMGPESMGPASVRGRVRGEHAPSVSHCSVAAQSESVRHVS